MTDDLNNEHSATEETPESGGNGGLESGSSGDDATGVTGGENVPAAVGEPSQEPDSTQDSGTEEGSGEEEE